MMKLKFTRPQHENVKNAVLHRNETIIFRRGV